MYSASRSTGNLCQRRSEAGQVIVVPPISTVRTEGDTRYEVHTSVAIDTNRRQV
jgi:hypothetical protein